MLLPVHPSLQAICQRDFDAATIKRGTGYQRQGRVKKLAVKPAEKGAGGLVLAARVRGSEPSPYLVTVTVERDGADGEPTGLRPMCSCPVGYACKHAFAVLAQAAVELPDLFDGEPESPAAATAKNPRVSRPATAGNPNLPAAWKRWAEGLRRAVLPGDDGAAGKEDGGDPRRLHFVLRPAPLATAEAGRPAGGSSKKVPVGGEGDAVPALTVEIVVADRRDEDGACLGKPTPLSLPVALGLGSAAARVGPGSFCPAPADRQLLRALLAAQPGFGSGGLALNYFGGGVGGGLNVLMQVAETSRLEGTAGTELLGALLATGRCHWENASTAPLRLGPALVGRPAWVLDAEGGQRPGFDLLTAEAEPLPPAPRLRFLALGGPWYLDPDAGVCGPVQTGWSDALATAWLFPPGGEPLPVELIGALGKALRIVDVDLPPGAPPPPAPRAVPVTIRRDVPLTPVLRVWTTSVRRVEFSSWGQPYAAPPRPLDVARLEFDYDGHRVAPGTPGAAIQVREPASGGGGEGAPPALTRILRQRPAEREAVERLRVAGLTPARFVYHGYEAAERGERALHGEDFVLPPPENRQVGSQQSEAELARDWLTFQARDLPGLRAAGWRVEVDAGFRHGLLTVPADAPGAWYAEAGPVTTATVPKAKAKRGQPSSAPAEAGPVAVDNDWFGVELGVTVDGQRLNLLPPLLHWLRTAVRGGRLDPGLRGLDALAIGGGVPVPLPARSPDAPGRSVLLPVERLRVILSALLELFDPTAALDAADRLALSPLQTAGLHEQLAEVPGAAAWDWQGGEAARALAAKLARLRDFRGIVPVPPPAGLRADLRPYQREGLSWLQFIREHELGGVLADDMGLGKTVQTLAHLLVERESGRAGGRPSLIVCPTSLLPNWRQETARFAPELSVLTLHGTARASSFAEIPKHDLILTSYALLSRDEEILAGHDYHLLVLDEAQFIKNPKTRAAASAARLRARARHPLCLTGTPLENHLGELWSLFHFLLPGFLGDERRFRAIFRTPIERENSAERRAQLARRVAPFLLRRRKEEVARDLPAKTEIIQPVELEGDQRDLYESIRLAMHERVREEVEKKGLARAQIIILDALLKLRQVCCDPRLLAKTMPAAAGRVKTSAKLALLLDLLPELVGEDRRVLLFSQFTSMLALIEPELARLNIAHLKLTGETRDRATPVRAFQAGAAPVFLISLKAGGTGLNLTAADTVIHYDPWWNPAVENQATDRAHRIGQDKPVFVYKLLTAGTVEEKIAAMQARKAELARGLLDPDAGKAGVKRGLDLSAEDLEALFAPLK